MFQQSFVKSGSVIAKSEDRAERTTMGSKQSIIFCSAMEIVIAHTELRYQSANLSKSQRSENEH
jgi:hypothetical protein